MIYLLQLNGGPGHSPNGGIEFDDLSEITDCCNVSVPPFALRRHIHSDALTEFHSDCSQTDYVPRQNPRFVAKEFLENVAKRRCYAVHICIARNASHIVLFGYWP